MRDSYGPPGDSTGARREAPLLYVLHASPFTPESAGAELHVRDLLGELALARAVVAYPIGQQLVFAEVLAGDIRNPIVYRFPLSKPVELFSIENAEVFEVVERALVLFGISAVHVHHLLRWPLTILKVFKRAGLKLIYTSHDYYCVCPSWNLFDFESRSACDCVQPGFPRAGCLAALFKELGIVAEGDLGALRDRHRAAWLELLDFVDIVVFPSKAAQQVVARYLPIDVARTKIIDHGCDLIRSVDRTRAGPKLRLAIVGDVANWIKGADNYVEIVQQTSGLPIEWHFFGRTALFGFEQRVRAASSSPVEFHGRYERNEIVDRLARAGIDLCVILPKVDETFSLILSESLIAGVPALTLEKGALPERLGEQGTGICVRTVGEAAGWIARACADRTELNTLAERARHFKHRSLSEMAKAHWELYESLGVLHQWSRTSPEHLRELSLQRETLPVKQEPPPERDGIPLYQGSFWYPMFLRFKPLIPKSIRAFGRKVLLRLEAHRH